jgi:phage shock protein A
MSDITPASTDRLLEALRQRERMLETDMAEARARLDEVREMLALVTSRPRGRPRAVRVVEPQPQQELMPEPPPEAA